MNKAILLVILPCVIALVMVNADDKYGSSKVSTSYYSAGVPYPYPQGGLLDSGLNNYGLAAAAELRSARLLNYLFGFLLLLDLTNATGNSITRLG